MEEEIRNVLEGVPSHISINNSVNLVFLLSQTNFLHIDQLFYLCTLSKVGKHPKMGEWAHNTIWVFQTLCLLGRFRRNIPIALTLIVRLPENFIIVSPIMAPRPQNHPHSKVDIYIYIYICGCAVLQAATFNRLQIKFGTKFSLDVNKNQLVFGDFSPKGVEMVGVWNLKKIITTLIWMILVWFQTANILLINL